MSTTATSHDHRYRGRGVYRKMKHPRKSRYATVTLDDDVLIQIEFKKQGAHMCAEYRYCLCRIRYLPLVLLTSIWAHDLSASSSFAYFSSKKDLRDIVLWCGHGSKSMLWSKYTSLYLWIFQTSNCCQKPSTNAVWILRICVGKSGLLIRPSAAI